jgi:dihydroorotate dehydrogenase
VQLRGIEIGNVLNASGARNFFGEGYPFHSFLKPFGLDYTGSTFVAKTTTLLPRAGNMPLRPGSVMPSEFKPMCIRVNWLQGAVLNAVGLSGPGAEWLLATGKWQARTEPFFISFMSVEKESDDRLREFAQFVELLKRELPRFKAPVMLQINVSCPNVGLEYRKLLRDVERMVQLAAPLGIVLIVKLNALVPPGSAVELCGLKDLDGICMSNTIPYGELPNEINWKKLFGQVSPLAHLGGGGLSGRPLTPIVERWIRDARAAGFNKAIIACGGILSIADADRMLEVGADLIELGSVSILYPWRVRGIIRHVNQRRARTKGARS